MLSTVLTFVVIWFGGACVSHALSGRVISKYWYVCPWCAVVRLLERRKENVKREKC
jgi:hypothetical protein